MSLRNQPLFIAGHPKSGTSLLLSIFDSHPELVVYPEESNFFRRYLPHARDRDTKEKISLSHQYLTHIFEWNQENPPDHQHDYPDRDYSNISVESIRQCVEKYIRESFRHDGEMLSAAVLSFGEVTNQITTESKYWVEKTPYTEYYAQDIFEWWPEAKMIHIIRDPRDNFASYRRKQPAWSAEFFSLNWLRSTRAGFSNRQKFGENRYLTLKFEDLTTSPDETLEEICDFLSITNNPSLRKPKRSGRIWKGNSMFDEKFTQISAAPIGRWKQSLEKDDALIIEALTALPMQDLNYPVSDLAITLDDALRKNIISRLLSYTTRRLRMPSNERYAVGTALDYLKNTEENVLSHSKKQAPPNIFFLIFKLFFSSI